MFWIIMTFQPYNTLDRYMYTFPLLLRISKIRIINLNETYKWKIPFLNVPPRKPSEPCNLVYFEDFMQLALQMISNAYSCELFQTGPCLTGFGHVIWVPNSFSADERRRGNRFLKEAYAGTIRPSLIPEILAYWEANASLVILLLLWCRQNSFVYD